MARNKQDQRTIAEMETALTGALNRIAHLEAELKKVATTRPQDVARQARKAARDEIEKRVPTPQEAAAEKVAKRREERRKNVEQRTDHPGTAPAPQPTEDGYARAYKEYRASLAPVVRAKFGGRAFPDGSPELARHVDKILTEPEYAYTRPKSQAEADAKAAAKETRARNAARSAQVNEGLPEGCWRDPHGIVRDAKGKPVPSEFRQAEIARENEKFGEEMRADTEAIHKRIFDPLTRPGRPRGPAKPALTLDEQIRQSRQKQENIERKRKRKLVDTVAPEPKPEAKPDDPNALTPEEHHRLRRIKRDLMKAENTAAQRAKLAAQAS